MDWLEVVRVFLIAAPAVALVAGGILVYHNAASKTLVLAASAFGAAVFAFLINLTAELRAAPPIRDRVAVEYTLDRTGPSIRTWSYPLGQVGRLGDEVGASTWLAERDPAAFGDSVRVNTHLAVFSLLSYLLHHQFD